MQENEELQPKKKSGNVFWVGLLSFFGGISQDVFTPILPIYLTSVLGFDKTFVGIAEGLVTASSSIFKAAAGFFSDKFKKQKPVIFLGYLLSAISRPLLALFTSGAAVFGLRFLDGTGKGMKDPPKDVLVADSAEKSVRGRSFGIVRMFDTLGSVAGPLILFLLLYFLKSSSSVYHYILLFSAIPLVITLFIIAAKLKEIKNHEPQTTAKSVISKPKLPSSFYLFLGIIILFTLGNSSDAFLILRAKNLGVTLIEIPIIIAIFNLIYALTSAPFGALSDKIGRIPTMLMGWAVFALVYLGFAFSTRAAAIWFLYGFYGIYYATNEGVAKAFLADIVGVGNRGKAFGIYGTIVGFATLPASIFAGFLWDKIGPQAPFYFGASVAASAAIILLVFSKRLKATKGIA